MPISSRVLRERAGDAAPRVTNVELFFDLVYVFAITQLSELLYDHGHLTARAALQTGVLFLAVWWAWNYTAWATNYLDPDRRPVALLMAVLMVVSLVMSAAIPEAFAGRGVPFAMAYVAIQLGRSAFLVWAYSLRVTMGRNYVQLLAWSAIAGVAWVVGAFVGDADARLAVWSGAVVLDLVAPMHGFWLPGLGSTPIGDWELAGEHLAERCQLVLMIAFGESVLRVGATFAASHGRVAVDAAFVLGFALTAALWGIYFMRHAEHGARAFERAPADAARIGRAAYAYAHAIMVAGVIVLAVAIHLAIAAPSADASTGYLAVTLGGPALYLVGMALYKRTVGRGVRPTLVGLALVVVPGLVAGLDDRLAVLAVVSAVCAGVLLRSS